MIEAAFWGFVGGFSMLLGAVAGLKMSASQRLIGLIMAFGAGVLISALAFELTEEAFRQGGSDAVAFGLAAGAIAFFAGDWILDHNGGDDRKRSGGQQEKSGGTAIVLGALLDGIPESIAIGVTLLSGNAVPLAISLACGQPWRSPLPSPLHWGTRFWEAFEHGGAVVGLVTVLGFASAFLLSTAG